VPDDLIVAYRSVFCVTVIPMHSAFFAVWWWRWCLAPKSKIKQNSLSVRYCCFDCTDILHMLLNATWLQLNMKMSY